jgi:hypothetical protein
MAAAEADSATVALRYQYRHIFMLPDLPDEDDYDAEHETEMLRRVLESLRAMADLAPPEDKPAFHASVSTTKTLQAT